ncbi:hypothetical protein SOASR014_33580 [Pectobacterium carotovorum subsp. carotovorum]|nr:hypothetical protein SOASR014_33580 [Pectobacterium carotovorum subsp. carotovorum]GLX45823.1 hypothetical protein Pcaca01_34910 [Pectobacterium carotovorum subsp. carotovorum]
MKTDLAYRYANAETFLKMLESQELWFTDLRNMNDWDEYSAGYRIAKELIINEFPNQIKVLENISREQMSDNFMMLICSLTNDGDCLSMWRGYGDNGRGAAVGYSTLDIENHHLFERYLQKLSPIQGRTKFHPVFYSEEEFKEQIRSYAHRLFTLSDDTPLDMVQDILSVRSHMFGNLLTKLCTLYKNDFFKDEREIRGFIEISDVVDPYNTNRRNTDFGDALYHKINSAFQGIPSIKEVVLGPLYEESDEYVRSKLNATGLSGVNIRRSKGTYR